MRSILIVYCGLTLLFTGGCVVLMAFFTGGETLLLLPQAIVTLAAFANAAFLWMALTRVPGRTLMALGVCYVAGQLLLAWKADLWTTLGPPALVVLVLFLVKGAAVYFAGQAMNRP